MADRINISLDETAQALWEKLEPEIKNVYQEGGRPEFFRDVLFQRASKKTRLEVKKQLLEEKIQALENRREDLKIEKDSVESRLQQLDVEDQNKEVDDSQFWEETVNILAENGSFDKQFRKFYDGRFKAYKKRFQTVPEPRFKEMLVKEMKERGYNDEADKIS